LEQLYRILASLGLPFETPEILSTHLVDGAAISIERELPGRPLREFISMDESSVAPFAEEALLTILSALANVEVSAPFPELPILGVRLPPNGVARSWNERIMEVFGYKISKFGSQLRASIPDFDWIVERIILHMKQMPEAAPRVVHGDLTPENILLDDQAG